MTIEERLEALETQYQHTKRQNRYLWGAVLLTVALGILGAAPYNPGKVLQANQFNLLDENGKTRAVLAMLAGGPTLAFYDEKGQTHAVLALSPDGPGLQFSDEKGQTRAGLDLAEGGPRLSLADEKGNIRVLLALTNRAEDLNLSEEKGKSRVNVVPNPNRRNPKNSRNEHNISGLCLYDANGTTRAFLDLTPIGPGLCLYDKNGGTRLAMDTDNKGPGLTLFNQTGKSIWFAP